MLHQFRNEKPFLQSPVYFFIEAIFFADIYKSRQLHILSTYNPYKLRRNKLAFFVWLKPSQSVQCRKYFEFMKLAGERELLTKTKQFLSRAARPLQLWFVQLAPVSVIWTFHRLYIYIYYIETSVLLEDIPPVKLIKATSGTRVDYFFIILRHFIDDVISVISLCYFIHVFLSL